VLFETTSDISGPTRRENPSLPGPILSSDSLSTPGQPSLAPSKILVSVKRVIDPDTRVRISEGAVAIAADGVKFAINPFDAIALEEAVRLKERNPGTEIVAVSIGAETSTEQLRSALAMGADRAILLLTYLPLDSLGVAKLLAKLCERERPGLILLGKQAIDDDSNQAGQMLAGLLDLPQATFVSKIEIDAGRLRCLRETDVGIEAITVSLPAVVTADLRLNEPRYVSLPSIMKAKKKPLEILVAGDLAIDFAPRTSIVRLKLPGQRKAGIRVKSVDELIEKLRAATGLV